MDDDFEVEGIILPLLTSKDPLDKTTRMTYYARGMLKTVEDANGKVTTYGDTALADGGYHPSGQPSKITDPLGMPPSGRWTSCSWSVCCGRATSSI